jgi:nicotinamide-nucleotide amidase
VGGTIDRASIISIGNEVLSGKTVDTNAAHIASQLRLIGVPVVSTYTIGDEMDAIVRVLGLAAADADLVIVTGGLGPTDDDLTRQAFAEFLGVELELHQDSLAAIKERFHTHGWEMPARNVIQAHVPRGAQPLANAWGTAPGIAAEKGGKLLFALPGVPGEMRHMLEASVLPLVRMRAQGQAIAVRRLRCFGAGESTIAEMLGEAMRRGRNPLVNCTASIGIITLEIVAIGADTEEAEALAAAEEVSLRSTLGGLVYGVGDQSLAEVLGAELARRGKTLALAESCTGGLIAKMMTDVPGASAYFMRGWVTYSNDAKIEELGVPADLIERHGAVSEAVALAMAEGARSRAHADYAIGITGIAGPTGQSEHKPAGLVYIAVSGLADTYASRHIFSRDRQAVRLRAAQTAIDTLRRSL